MTDDGSLLLKYADGGDEAAFTEFVHRHIRAVYAAALRRLGSPQLAPDATQLVFIAAARNARRLAAHPHPVAWLFTASRNAALDVAKRERRRQTRESRIIAESTTTAMTDTLDSRFAERVITDAIDSLSASDREAVLLRFFESKSFAEIGERLGLADNAARMKVERALSKLHEFLARRGITTTAALLGSSLVSQAASVAMPSGLAATVVTSALSNAAATAAAGSSIIAFMANSKLTLAAVAVAAGVGGTIAVQQITGRHVQPPAAVATEATVPTPPRPAPTTETQLLRGENQRLREALQQMAATATSGVPGKVAQLRDILDKLPDQRIPEFVLLEEDDWYAAVDGPLETVEDYRIALSKLRGRAENRFARQAQPALRARIAATGTFPKSTQELKAHFEKPIDDAILARYKVAPADEVPFLRMGGEWIITQNGRVDPEYDAYVGIGPRGFGTASRGKQDQQVLEPVMQAFSRANPGAKLNDPLQLLPYASTPEQRSAIERTARTLSRR